MSNIPTMIILVGPPAAGKSTFAVEWLDEDPGNRERINYDHLRIELFGEDWVFNRPEEEAMKVEARARAITALKRGKSVIIDNTNLSKNAVETWRSIGLNCGAGVIIQHINTPIQTCIERDSKREGRARVGRAVIERMALFNALINWDDQMVYPRDFIIVDMDGTIASCEARRARATIGRKHKRSCCDCCGNAVNGVHPKGCIITDVRPEDCAECRGGIPKIDWDKFYVGCQFDPPIDPIVSLVKKLSVAYDLLIVSGRPLDKAGKQTEAWLNAVFQPDMNRWPAQPVRHLFMRNGGDSRPDYIIKEEILSHLPKNRIRFCIDDRDQVVKMWRKNGLTCLQVAEGDF